MTDEDIKHFPDTCICGENDSQVSLLNFTLDSRIPGDVMWSLMDGKHNVSLPQHDGLFVDRVDDFLDEKIDGGTEDVFDSGEDNTVKEDGGEMVDIILSRPKCGF